MGLLKQELMNRIVGLCGHLQSEGIDCALLMQNVDQYYYSGTFQDGVLMIHSDCAPVLFVRRTLSRAIEESPLEQILGYRKLHELRDFLHHNRLSYRTIGLDMDVIPAKLYRGLVDIFPDSSFIDISGFIRRQRAVKSSYEISHLRVGGRKFDRVFEKLKENIRAGMSEYGLYQRFIQLLLEEGSSLYIRTRKFNMEATQNFILSGESAAHLSSMDSPTAAGTGISKAYPYGAGIKKLYPGEPILVDSVYIEEGYIVDCTRIFAIDGLDNRFIEAHDVSRACHDLFCKHARPGTSIPDLYRKIMSFVDKKGLIDVFMGGVNFIGHGVGLELDEFPVITERFEDTLQEGMVIAFEPKFVFPDGTVGYENTYYVNNSEPFSFNQSEESIQIV